MQLLRSFARIGAVATASLLSVAVAASAPASAASPGSSVLPSVNGRNHSLNSDSCPNAAFCMAVGNYDLGRRVPGLSEVLSAGHWVVKPVPSPGRGSNIFANEVSCASATNCLFAGDHWKGSKGKGQVLAESWNGSKWHVVAGVGPAGTSFSSLNDVSCPASNFCLVIGDAGTAAKRFHDIAYTWRNGTTWRQSSVPQPPGARSSELGGLACSDVAHCMAVGDYTSAAGRFLPFAARWTSGHWKLLTVPAVRGQRETVLQGVSCPTATKCVAVGNTEDNSKGEFFHAFSEVWNGGRWHISPLRRLPSVLIGVSCPAARRCFATGYTFPSARSYAHQLIETWNGSTWAVQHPAQTAGLGGDLPHVSCVSAVACETVGFAFFPNSPNSDEAITEGWNGHRWRGQVTPNP